MNTLITLYRRNLEDEKPKGRRRRSKETDYVGEFDGKLLCLSLGNLKKLDDFCFLFVIDKEEANEEIREISRPGVTCGLCGGTGHIPSFDSLCDDGEEFRFVDEKCPDCDGEGTLIGRLFQKRPLPRRFGTSRL
jgi:hypothetical protein